MFKTPRMFRKPSFLLPAVLLLVFSAGCQQAVSKPDSNVSQINPEQPTVLITGSNRGIGFGFVQHYAAEGWNVIATARSPAKATELQALAAANPNVVVEQLDVTDLSRIEALAELYRDTPIDVLINNAAILGDLDQQAFGTYDYELFQQVMAINVFGPMKMTEAFLPSILLGEQKKVVTLASGIGSIQNAGGMKQMSYYKMSKAAMNMSMRGIRSELKPQGVTVALLAPGMVGTQLLADSGWTGPSLTPEESAIAVAANIAALTTKDRGKVVNYNGKVIPW